MSYWCCQEGEVGTFELSEQALVLNAQTCLHAHPGGTNNIWVTVSYLCCQDGHVSMSELSEQALVLKAQTCLRARPGGTNNAWVTVGLELGLTG